MQIVQTSWQLVVNHCSYITVTAYKLSLKMDREDMDGLDRPTCLPSLSRMVFHTPVNLTQSHSLPALFATTPESHSDSDDSLPGSTPYAIAHDDFTPWKSETYLDRIEEDYLSDDLACILRFLEHQEQSAAKQHYRYSMEVLACPSRHSSQMSVTQMSNNNTVAGSSCHSPQRDAENNVVTWDSDVTEQRSKLRQFARSLLQSLDLVDDDVDKDAEATAADSTTGMGFARTIFKSLMGDGSSEANAKPLTSQCSSDSYTAEKTQGDTLSMKANKEVARDTAKNTSHVSGKNALDNIASQKTSRQHLPSQMVHKQQRSDSGSHRSSRPDSQCTAHSHEHAVEHPRSQWHQPHPHPRHNAPPGHKYVASKDLEQDSSSAQAHLQGKSKQERPNPRKSPRETHTALESHTFPRYGAQNRGARTDGGILGDSGARIGDPGARMRNTSDTGAKIKTGTGAILDRGARLRHQSETYARRNNDTDAVLNTGATCSRVRDFRDDGARIRHDGARMRARGETRSRTTGTNATYGDKVGAPVTDVGRAAVRNRLPDAVKPQTGEWELDVDETLRLNLGSKWKSESHMTGLSSGGRKTSGTSLRSNIPDLGCEMAPEAVRRLMTHGQHTGDVFRQPVPTELSLRHHKQYAHTRTEGEGSTKSSRDRGRSPRSSPRSSITGDCYPSTLSPRLRHRSPRSPKALSPSLSPGHLDLQTSPSEPRSPLEQRIFTRIYPLELEQSGQVSERTQSHNKQGLQRISRRVNPEREIAVSPERKYHLPKSLGKHISYVHLPKSPREKPLHVQVPPGEIDVSQGSISAQYDLSPGSRAAGGWRDRSRGLSPVSGPTMMSPHSQDDLPDYIRDVTGDITTVSDTTGIRAEIRTPEATPRNRSPLQDLSDYKQLELISEANLGRSIRLIRSVGDSPRMSPSSEGRVSPRTPNSEMSPTMRLKYRHRHSPLQGDTSPRLVSPQLDRDLLTKSMSPQREHHTHGVETQQVTSTVLVKRQSQKTEIERTKEDLEHMSDTVEGVRSPLFHRRDIDFPRRSSSHSPVHRAHKRDRGERSPRGEVSPLSPRLSFPRAELSQSRSQSGHSIGKAASLGSSRTSINSSVLSKPDLADSTVSSDLGLAHSSVDDVSSTESRSFITCEELTDSKTSDTELIYHDLMQDDEEWFGAETRGDAEGAEGGSPSQAVTSTEPFLANTASPFNDSFETQTEIHISESDVHTERENKQDEETLTDSLHNTEKVCSDVEKVDDDSVAVESSDQDCLGAEGPEVFYNPLDPEMLEFVEYPNVKRTLLNILREKRRQKQVSSKLYHFKVYVVQDILQAAVTHQKCLQQLLRVDVVLSYGTTCNTVPLNCFSVIMNNMKSGLAYRTCCSATLHKMEFYRGQIKQTENPTVSTSEILNIKYYLF